MKYLRARSHFELAGPVPPNTYAAAAQSLLSLVMPRNQLKSFDFSTSLDSFGARSGPHLGLGWTIEGAVGGWQLCFTILILITRTFALGNLCLFLWWQLPPHGGMPENRVKTQYLGVVNFYCKSPPLRSAAEFDLFMELRADGGARLRVDRISGKVLTLMGSAFLGRSG